MPFLEISVEDTLEKAGLSLEPRARTAPMKKAMFAALRFWHKRYIGRHFTPSARGRYGAGYSKLKPKKGHRSPLVKTGRLKRVMKSGANRSRITGTSKRATMTMPIGRPKAFTKAALLEATFIAMKRDNLTFTQAQKQVFSRAGYGARNIGIFKEAISAVTDGEAEQMARELSRTFLEEVRKAGKAKRRKIK